MMVDLVSNRLDCNTPFLILKNVNNKTNYNSYALNVKITFVSNNHFQEAYIIAKTILKAEIYSVTLNMRLKQAICKLLYLYIFLLICNEIDYNVAPNKLNSKLNKT